MGQVVMVAYRPREGKADRLRELVRDHVPLLRTAGLVTDRPALVLRAADGTLVEVFEWAAADAAERAAGHPLVQDVWTAFAEACEYAQIGSLAEAGQVFAAFDVVEFGPEAAEL